MHENNILVTVGDFNTRFHPRRQGEEFILGPHIYGKGEEFMQKTIDRDHNGTHNRTLTVEWLMENGMIVANTTKTKPLEKLITFRDKKKETMNTETGETKTFLHNLTS